MGCLQSKNVKSTLTSRTGREKQRYNPQGHRLVVGCIPYRFNGENLEVLLISSPKDSRKLMFPKGGWENDEKMEQAAHRETKEEAGVTGSIGKILGTWFYEGRGGAHEASMYPMLVKKELENWSEKKARTREWITVDEARNKCTHQWMINALNEFNSRFA